MKQSKMIYANVKLDAITRFGLWNEVQHANYSLNNLNDDINKGKTSRMIYVMLLILKSLELM